MRSLWLVAPFLLAQACASSLAIQDAWAAPVEESREEMHGAISENKPNSVPTDSAVEPRYPVLIEKIALLDLATGKSKPAKLVVKDKLAIQISEIQGASSTIDSASIVEWSVGNFSETKFSGGRAVSGGLGFAAGALLVPSPATPLLLLLAPMMGMASANVYKPDWRIGLREIDINGREQLVLVQAFNERDAATLRSILEAASGLKAGQRRSDTELVSLRVQRLEALEKQLQEAKLPLTRTITNKPWCSTLDLTGKTANREAYDRLVESVNGLRKALAKEPYVEPLTNNSSFHWDAYLAERPDLAMWAGANPSAAEQLRRCPALVSGS